MSTSGGAERRRCVDPCTDPDAEGARHAFEGPIAAYLGRRVPADDATRGGEHGTALLALQLPRDRTSVPITRHIVRYALSAFGVPASVADDMELALSEACSNVLNHAGPTDSYEVSLLVGGERCELRVTDKGRGFDHETVRARRTGAEEERGRGLTIMQAVMDAVDFASGPERGTLVTLVKRLDLGGTSAARLLPERSAPGSGMAVRTPLAHEGGA